MNVEIDLNNTLNKSQIELDFVIQNDKLLLTLYAHIMKTEEQDNAQCVDSPT